MFDGISVAFVDRRLDAPYARETLPWQLVVLLICFTTILIVLAILYPDFFGRPLEQL